MKHYPEGKELKGLHCTLLFPRGLHFFLNVHNQEPLCVSQNALYGGKFINFILSSADFFKIESFQKFFQDYHLSVQQFESRPAIIKLFSCSTQLSTEFNLLINVKMPTIVGILTFISMINTTSERLKQETSLFFD